ncbi:SusC/RagA family TonB-linked outer membrane protein [Flavisolibacter ginsenosidimutans]|uniref:TonB-dependent receptor n=1 Tax=Flavisolibacter ginsenosidimutans TaxID=661481 RepID=A0A5B8UPH9_9BACT|nr:TonB-dependent receptor [Flavisolibacter ginsenosidimutans]QEC58262.1 TonB-dependent receptor [Flavisolibacter ginsenosidimutans]
MRKNPTALFRSLGLLSFLLLSSVFVQAQVSVSGKVTDETNKPIEGVTVQVNGAKTSTLTRADGSFQITVPSGNARLIFSSVGFERQEVAVNNQAIINVPLQSTNSALQDVVVIGYATVRKKDVTGAVSGLSQNEIKSRPVQDAVQAMQGKVAGVDITSNERPGSLGTINIRGVRSLLASNSPLFVVDGIPLVSGGIDNFNPADIESIDILKDASATAIYGSRGANGVVIVTTKQGKNGRVNLNVNSSLRFDNLVDNEKMFSAADYITFRRWAYYYAGLNYATGISTNPRGDQPTLATDRTFFNATADPAAWANIAKGWASGKWDGSAVTTTDWRGLVTQQSVTSDNSISVSGGTDKMRAYASFGYLNNTGTVKGQSYKRYTTNVNIEITPTKWFTFGSNVSVAYSVQQYGQSTRNVSTIGTPSGGLYESARSLFPYAVPYDSAGNRVLFPGGDNSWKNVVDEWNYNIDQRTTVRAFGSINGQVDIGNIFRPLKGLRYRMNFGPDIDLYTDGVYIDANSVANGGSTSYASLLKGKAFSYTLDNLLYYDKTIGAHSFGITLLASQTAFNADSSTINGNGIPFASQKWNALTSGTVTGTLSTSSNLVEQQLLSYMGRVNYSFKDKYLLTASIRRDGSSVFAKGHQYDNFPSAALAWRISREDFLQHSTWVNELKLRAGVGVTGNSAVAPYSTQGAIVSLFYPFSSTNTPGAYTNPLLANQDLKWEKTQQVNVGLDFSLFNRRVSGSVDVYSSKTSDLLLNRNLPSVTGYNTTYFNIGKTANNGIDISVSTVNYRSRSMLWTTTVNASWQKDHIVALSNGNQDDITNSLFIGQPLGVIYGYKALGIWQPGDTTAIKAFNANGGSFSPGFTRVADLNGDNKIDPNNDRQIIGWTRPRWVVGMTNTFVYKGVELSVFIYGRLHYWYNTGGEGEAARGVTRQINYYTPDNTNSEYQKPVYNAGNASLDPYFAALGYKKASFIKVRNISLGYTVNNKYLGKAGVSNLKAYVQVANPGMLFSQIKYLDMDVVSPTWNRGVTFGINATF